MIKERIDALRTEMKKRGIDIYYVPTSDFHETEYVGEYFKARKFITGFTGSTGVAVITQDMAGLWTDGRYFVQAEMQLKDTPVELFRMGEEGVPKVQDFIADKCSDGTVIGFDGRVVNYHWYKDLRDKLEGKDVRFHITEDLIDLIWADRPALPAEPVELFEDRFSGFPTEEKLQFIREQMKEAETDAHVLSTLDNICWLFNIRGNDVSHFPVVLSFAVVDDEKAVLFVNPKTIGEEVESRLSECGISIKPYNDIYGYAKESLAGKKVMLDSKVVNTRLYEAIESVAEIVDMPNPEVLKKAIKTPTELENIRRAHIKDGIACTKFMYWVKKNVGKIPMTELSAQDYLAKLRAEQSGFLDLSFDTICAYGPNAAMMHYEATPESYAVIEPKGFLLVDSGGHYKDGSTDITRTIALGELTYEQRMMYTAVLKGNMRLAAAKFMYGCRGVNLDYLTRAPLWERGRDYRCGTGHGVGYRLNIHEAPNGFRWKIVDDRNDSCVLEEGMVTTDEPGYYEDGSYGIRIENEMVCRKGPKTEYGQFMQFETITYCPIDLEPVIMNDLEKSDKENINAYHKMVYKTLEPYFEGDELEFLKEVTKEI